MSEKKQIFQFRRSIARRPSEGGSDPSWRLKRVETYLEALAGTDPRKTMHLEDLRKENDAIVLNFLALRQGKSGVAPAHVWAWRVYQENDSAGMGAVIKALAFAGCPGRQIASWLGVSEDHVEVFLQLFWEIEELIKAPGLRNSFAFGPLNEDRLPSQEYLLLLAAYHDGLDGVRLMLTPEVGFAPEERERFTNQVHALDAFCGFLDRAAIALVGLPEDPCSRRPYLNKLRALLDRPESVLPQREKTFEAVMRALGSGMALGEFL